MHNTRIVRLATVLAVSAVVASTGAALPPTRAQLGREVKLRILVDKVMQPERGWTTEEWMVRETAEAGFNVFSPRRGFDDLAAVRQVTAWCRQYGIFHLVWMRGSLEAPAGAEAAGKRMLWANGSEQLLWGPDADEFWGWTSRYVLEYARISAADPTLMGVFLDYENYAKGGAGNLYSLSYDDGTLAAFAKTRGVALPALAPDARAAWLREQGLHDAFEQFQVSRWRERCRTLRQEVDAIDPAFQFCVYPAPGTPFMVQGIYPEWGTAKAPLILADPVTYGRPSRLMPQRSALEANRRMLLKGMETAGVAAMPHALYSGGIDPIVQGADPEFCGRNALMICEATPGYWVFYEGPKYRENHADYFKWFAWANRAATEGRLTDWQQPRETPEDWMLQLRRQVGGEASAALVPPTGAKVILTEPSAFRGENLFLVSCRKGLPVELTAQLVQVGRYECELGWEVRDPAWKTAASGTIPGKEPGTIAFTPAEDGLYLLGLSAGACAARVLTSNAPVGLLTEGGASLIYAARRLYLLAPPQGAEFSISVSTAGAETVRVTLYRPDDSVAESAQTTPEKPDAKVQTAAWEPGQVWALELGKADTGVLEDVKVRFGKDMVPLLALCREYLAP